VSGIVYQNTIKQDENSGLVTGMIAKGMIKIYYSAQGGSYYNFSGYSKYVSDINFDVFTSDARIQIHGYNTAKDAILGDTLTEAFSKESYQAGNKKAYIIGHMKKSNPNINGAATINTTQDYRHGKRAIIDNGEIIKKTHLKGFIPYKDILGLIGKQNG
jgi:hypothetical protein